MRQTRVSKQKSARRTNIHPRAGQFNLAVSKRNSSAVFKAGHGHGIPPTGPYKAAQANAHGSANRTVRDAAAGGPQPDCYGSDY